MEEFRLSVIHPDGSWYHRERTMDALIAKLKIWNEKLDPSGKKFRSELEEVEAWRKLYLMRMMIFRAHGLAIFPSRYEGTLPK